MIAIKLDYTIESPEERKKLVEQILEKNPNPTPQYLEVLADYLVLCMEKQEKKEKRILTDNRMVTINKRECSFEGLASQLENGEDGVYNMMTDNKNSIFQPKIQITKEDLNNIPFLRQLREAITSWEKLLRRSSGKTAFIIKKALIEMRKEQYIIKQAYQKPISFCHITRGSDYNIMLDDTSYLDFRNEVSVRGISLMNPKICSAILCNYSNLKQDSYDVFDGDTWYLIADFENTCDRALKTHPTYKRILEMKIDGMQNAEIQRQLQEEFDMTYTVEYISTIWRIKIPRIIAAAATDEFLAWQFNKHHLPMKKCTKCGQIKPAHNHFFSRNKASKDGLYSICKVCRNKKKEGD